MSLTQKDNLRGILLMVAAMSMFAVEDMFLKWSASGLPVGMVIFVAGAFGAPVFIMMARAQGQRTFVRAALHPAVLARNLGEVVGTFTYIYALAVVDLSTVSAVLQALPLAVTLGAALFMGETVRWRRWLAIAVGLTGVMVVIRPGFDGFQPPALWVLVTVLALALRDLATRAIPVTCSSAQVSAWGLMSISMMGAVMMAIEGVARPDTEQVMTLGGAVVFGTIGYWLVVTAARTGEVSVVAPFRYARLVFALILGVLVFGERPDVITLTGSALIIGSGLYTFARERALRRKQSQSV